jgi:hypothetical protein
MPPVSRCFALFKHSVRGTSSNHSRLASKYLPPLSIFDVHIRTRLLGRGGMLPDAAQVLHAFGNLSVPDGWKVLYFRSHPKPRGRRLRWKQALGNMLDLMVSRTPGDSSHFHPLCARMQGISADHIQPASKSAPDNPSPSLTGTGQSEHTTGEPPCN